MITNFDRQRFITRILEKDREIRELKAELWNLRKCREENLELKNKIFKMNSEMLTRKKK